MRISHESWLQPRSLLWPWHGQCVHCQHGSWCLLHKICQALALSSFPTWAAPAISHSITVHWLLHMRRPHSRLGYGWKEKGTCPFSLVCIPLSFPDSKDPCYQHFGRAPFGISGDEGSCPFLNSLSCGVLAFRRVQRAPVPSHAEN